ERVFKIPIGIDLEHFSFRPPRSEPGFVIGSFLKDGVGMDEGMEPKLLKGPDTFVAVVAQLRERIPDLSVLLTGPARGYVRAELGRLGVPYEHRLLGSRADLGLAYGDADVCLVTSRQEGGPKAVLEAMASGGPGLSTPGGPASGPRAGRRKGSPRGRRRRACARLCRRAPVSGPRVARAPARSGPRDGRGACRGAPRRTLEATARRIRQPCGLSDTPVRGGGGPACSRAG